MSAHSENRVSGRSRLRELVGSESAPCFGWYRRLGRGAIAIATALIVTMLCCAPARSAAPQTAAVFAEANRDYAEGRFAQAVNGYSALLAQNGYSASVLINRGNAWRQLNQPGRAILDYERALWLGPSNSGAVAASLKTAQQQAGLVVTQPTLLWLSLATLNALAWLAGAAALTISVAVLASCSTRPSWARAIQGLAALGAAAFVVAGAILVMHRPEFNRAVVLDAGTPVHIAPAASADVSFSLPAGDLVQIGKRYGAYAAVRAAHGRSGWVAARQIAKIVPPAEDRELSLR